VQERDSDSATQLLNLAGAVLGLIYLLWAMWTIMVPETARREWKLRLTLWSAQAMSRLGRRAAAGSLAREATTGQANYELPYALMSAACRLETAYRKMTL
jgi:hypothetical protein